MSCQECNEETIVLFPVAACANRRNLDESPLPLPLPEMSSWAGKQACRDVHLEIYPTLHSKIPKTEVLRAAETLTRTCTRFYSNMNVGDALL